MLERIPEIFAQRQGMRSRRILSHAILDLVFIVPVPTVTWISPCTPPSRLVTPVLESKGIIKRLVVLINPSGNGRPLRNSADRKGFDPGWRFLALELV